MTTELGFWHATPHLAMPMLARPMSLREKVFAIEKEMLKHEQLDLPLRHYFSSGVYAREMSIPKGTLLTGKIHKYAHILIMSKGDVSVLTQDGIVRVQAPFTIVSPPGTKRIAYAHEDSVWTTIHRTDETDIDRIEEYFVAKSDDEFLAFIEQTKRKEIT